MRKLWIAAVLAGTLMAAQTRAADRQGFAPVTVNALPAGAQTRPVQIARLTIDYPTGKQWATYRRLNCLLPREKMKWDGIDKRDARLVEEAINREFNKAGFRVVGDNRDLFNTTEQGEFEIGGTIIDLNGDLCTGTSDGSSPLPVKGVVTMSVEWQIYSRVERKLVSKITTTGGDELKRGDFDGVTILFAGAFADNVRALINASEFRAAFIGSSRPADQKVAVGKPGAAIALSAPKTGSVAISDTVGSVVTVITGGGHGSGVLIGSEGYFLTNSHVVGDNKTVRVRFSDGFEVDGEVVRSQRARDVALIKATAHGRQPLAMKAGSLQPGTPIYAIGAPLDAKFSGTVTKGIVSANRIMDGFSYIQSDVTVNPGNSGGPLLDEQGRVVGLTVLSYRPEGGPTGLNLFIPIGDAIDFLGLNPQ